MGDGKSVNNMQHDWHKSVKPVDNPTEQSRIDLKEARRAIHKAMKQYRPQLKGKYGNTK
jgi:hypothetical protein